MNPMSSPNLGGHAADSGQSLVAAGLRRTPMRLAMLDVLAAASAPLTAPEILQRLPAHADSVTVYRTLNTFTDTRLVHRVRGEDRCWRYALSSNPARAEHRHPHFVCDGCGVIECMAKSKIPASFVRSLQVSRRYRVSFSEVTLHGLCPRCA